MIYLYARASSRAQDNESQLPDLDRWVAELPHELHQDNATGATLDRPGWNSIVSKLKKGDTIVVWRLDRLGRTVSGLSKLFDEFVKMEINLVSIKDGIDLSTAAGRLLANVLASVAQFETEARKSRVAAGIAAAKAKGRRWGGSKKGRMSKSTASKQQIETIHRLFELGHGPTFISKAIDLSRQTVYRHLDSLKTV